MCRRRRTSHPGLRSKRGSLCERCMGSEVERRRVDVASCERQYPDVSKKENKSARVEE